MNLVKAFKKTFNKYPDRTAIEFEDEKVSFKELDLISDRVAAGLKNLGVEKGDRVAQYVENGLDLIYFLLGTLKACAISVPINCTFKEQEIRHILSNSGAKLILTDNKRIDRVRNVLPDLKELKNVISINKDKNTIYFDDLKNSNEKINVEIEKDDGAIMFYTSGTTGKPKGALLSHFNILSDLEALKEAWHWSSEDRLLLALPMFHIHGLGVALCGSFYIGNEIILRPKFIAEEILQLIQKKKITLFMGVPAMYCKILEVQDKKKYDLSSMRLFVSGSAPLSKETFNEFKEIFGFEILERAGMSETMMNFSNPYDGKRKPGTVGFPLKCVEIKIVDKNFNDVKEGKEGEILLKGHNVFNGYWSNEEKTNSSFHDEWFITGDIGKRDKEGYISFVGRSKDVIISGGLNIYPREVEDVLETHPNVKEAAVVGIPDKCFGESVKAFVVFENNSKVKEEELIKYCKEKIASYKKPKYVEFIKELPKNAMGKLQKDVLRKL